MNAGIRVGHSLTRSEPVDQAGFYAFRFFSYHGFIRKSLNKLSPICTANMDGKKKKKASTATENQKLDFCAATNQLLMTEPSIKIDCIVAKKENVQPHIRTDLNKLYNYMLVPEFVFIPDKRSVKVESGNSLSDYLQTVLWFECGASTVIDNHPQESHNNYNLQFVDWISSCVWSHFEDGESNVYKEISRPVNVRTLFF